MSCDPSAHPAEAPADKPSVPPVSPVLRLPGDVAIWLVILLEGATFCVLFASFAITRALHLELFNASQRMLSVTVGAINTALLLTSGWCVARAVQAVRADARARALGWLAAGMAGGACFVALKVGEYAEKAARGIGLSTNLFFDLYYILTGFHLLHVLAGLAALLTVAVGLLRQRPQPQQGLNAHAIETVAAFWHLVDLLWLVLFPLVYVLH